MYVMARKGVGLKHPYSIVNGLCFLRFAVSIKIAAIHIQGQGQESHSRRSTCLRTVVATFSLKVFCFRHPYKVPRN